MKMLFLVMSLLQAQQMNDCIKDPKIETPKPPVKKIDLCEVILGFHRDGSDIDCVVKANGSCEVQ